MLTGCYVVSQGAQFLTYQARARSVERAEERWPEYAPLFSEAAAIRAFGEEALGLSGSRSYRKFVKLERDYLVTVVSAAKQTSFERKTWKFPVVGEVPYKGFYRGTGARRLTKKLRSEGWEVYARKVDAFSSLGYFRDPLYSFMASYHPERLSNLVLHEMTHATIWIRDDAPLNEAIAGFIGDEAALKYLNVRYGPESEIYREGVLRQEERRRFVRFMRELADRLETLYDSGVGKAEILRRREAIFRQEKRRFSREYAEWFSDDRYRFFLDVELNNAYVDLFRTYNEDADTVATLYASVDQNLPELIALLKELGESEEPRKRLRSMIVSGRE